MFGMSWLILLGGIGIIWGIITDNLMWGLTIGGGLGWFIDYFLGDLKVKKKNKQ